MTEEVKETLTLKEQVLNKILDHTVIGYEYDEETKAETKVEKRVRDIIDEDTDIWYPKNSSEERPRPVMGKTAIKKLMKFTKAEVVESIIRERQSDAPSQEREQVWIEITVQFPDGSKNTDDGVANRWNAKDNISGANLPIMARKRGISRAFLQSDYIGLFDVYDENESESFSKEANENIQLKEQVQKLYNQLENGKNEYNLLRNKVLFFARLYPDDPKYPNELVKDVWFKHKDREYMEELEKHQDEMVKYVAQVMLRTTIPNEERKEKMRKKKQEA